MPTAKGWSRAFDDAIPQPQMAAPSELSIPCWLRADPTQSIIPNPAKEATIMSDNVIFQRPGPFGLPPAQSATAAPLNGLVEVRIRAFVDGNPDTLVIQMTAGIALELAAQLGDAAVKAKKQK
jgi:hypothetical protein